MKSLDLVRDRNTIRALFASNEIFAYPTEAVYGIGGKPCALTYQKIIRLKGRDPQKGVILVAASWKQAASFLGHIPKEQWDILQTWERDGRATTFILPAAKHIPTCLCDGENHHIAVRVSQHPQVRALCELCQSPLISTSANPSGAGPATSPEMVKHYFPNLMLIAGTLGSEMRPSRIVDLFSNTILRD